MTELEKKVNEIHFCLMDPRFGVCSILKNHDETLNGNGSMGLKTKVKVLWLASGGAWAVILAGVIKGIVG